MFFLVDIGCCFHDFSVAKKKLQLKFWDSKGKYGSKSKRNDELVGADYHTKNLKGKMKIRGWDLEPWEERETSHDCKLDYQYIICNSCFFDLWMTCFSLFQLTLFSISIRLLTFKYIYIQKQVVNLLYRLCPIFFISTFLPYGRFFNLYVHIGEP